ncbi:MAG: response regulator [Fibrobacterota bacterium]|nr:MAG: response regulator [Fibrobacterota bacterium]
MKTPTNEKPRICIAEDDNISRMLLTNMLTKWGYDVTAHSDGQAAFQELSEDDGPRLALLDWVMPGMDGIKTCQRIRSEFPRRTYYLLLVTSKTDDEDIVSALRSGADDYVSKPYSPHVLQARLEVGMRTLSLQRSLSDYANRMETLAADRAAQLVHADRMSSLGILSASVAHEINNPANFISVNVQTLRSSWPSVERILSGTGTEHDRKRALSLGAEMPDLLSEMEEGVNRIRRITSELRAFSRTGGNEVSPVDVGACLQKALRMCSSRTKGFVDVRFSPPEALPTVLADALKLEQVFVNLILNASDAMEESKVRQLDILVVQEASSLVVRFQDSGPGVPPDKRESIFQPFFTTKPIGKGTGLGLHISRNLVEECKGTLTLAEATGSGACFEVRLPVPSGQ